MFNNILLHPLISTVLLDSGKISQNTSYFSPFELIYSEHKVVSLRLKNQNQPYFWPFFFV